MYQSFCISIDTKRNFKLPTQSILQFSDYTDSYNLIIHSDNILHKINDMINFSFVHKRLIDKYCQDNGCTTECPIRILKLSLSDKTN